MVDHKARVRGIQSLRRVMNASSPPFPSWGYAGAMVVAFAESIAADMIR